MQKIRIYQVDAFTQSAFGGNPAAVCPLESWLSDQLMQQIAMENNLAETAFYVKDGSRYQIRWFTPAVEVDLCGHATLAAAFVLFNHEGENADSVEFYSHRSGKLGVAKQGDLLTLDFPKDEFKRVESFDSRVPGFELAPKEIWQGKTDYMLVYDNQDQIESLEPDMIRVKEIPGRGVIVTAKGKQTDFVSRFFAPQSGINEDPVTGSAHTTLTPYWSRVLGKKKLTAAQLSKRKGLLNCELFGDRVRISGYARLYLSGEIFV